MFVSAQCNLFLFHCGNKGHPKQRANRDWLFSAFYIARVSRHHLHLAETQRQCGVWEIFRVEEKKGALGHALIGGCWNTKLEAGKLEARCLRWMVMEGHLAEARLCSPKGMVKKKKRWGSWQSLVKSWSFSADCYQRLTVRVILSYINRPLFICTFSCLPPIPLYSLYSIFLC